MRCFVEANEFSKSMDGFDSQGATDAERVDADEDDGVLRRLHIMHNALCDTCCLVTILEHAKFVETIVDAWEITCMSLSSFPSDAAKLQSTRSWRC